MPLEKKYRSRLILFLVMTLLWCGFICTRLVYLQIVKCEDYKKEAAARQETIQDLEPRRGTIFDRNGKILAMSVETESFVINPQVIGNPSTTLAQCARVLKIDLSKLMKDFQDRKAKDKKFFFVKRKITLQEKKEILKLHIDGLDFCKGKSRYDCESKGHMEMHFREAGFSFEPEYKRYYPKGTLASHIIGVSDIDQTGLDGVESQYNSFLKGKPIYIQVTKDAAGNEFPAVEVADERSERHLVLTIDEVVQYIAEKELERAFSDAKAYKGCAIVINPSNGEILALANRPSFNLNRVAQYPSSSRRNIAITDLYEPGSTFKAIGLSALVEHDKFNPREIINCGNGTIRIAGTSIDDHHPYDALSAIEVFEKSSNVGVIKLTRRISDQEFYKEIKSFGFGEKTGIDLPGEVGCGGLVRPPSRWSKLSHAVLSIGQEIAVTPIQMLTAYSALANGGYAVQPHVAKGYIDLAGKYEQFDHHRKRKVIEEKTARTVTGVLEGVILNGTGKKARIPGYSAAGKTGTAQIFDTKLKTFLKDRYVASFVGYAPSVNPEILCLVMLDIPKGKEYYGGDVAAPAFSKIVGETLSYLQIPPNRETLSAAKLQTVYPHDPNMDTASPPFPSRALLVKNHADLSAFPFNGPVKFSQSSETFPAVDVDDGLMPDLAGRSLRDALCILTKKGCMTKVSGKGYVNGQCPEAGASLSRGDICYLLLSDDLVKLQEDREAAQDKEHDKKGGNRH